MPLSEKTLLYYYASVPKGWGSAYEFSLTKFLHLNSSQVNTIQNKEYQKLSIFTTSIKIYDRAKRLLESIGPKANVLTSLI